MSINFGIIGHGFMGHVHENMLTGMDGVRVAAIADIENSRLEDVGNGIKRYINPSDLINDPEVQVVLIAANNNQHRPLVLEAARAGKDVLCEKPVAMSLFELDEMETECKKYGVKFTVHHQRRFDPDFRTVKTVYNSETLGNISTVKSSLYSFNGNMHGLRVFKDEGGGMLYGWGVHLIDQMLWMIPGKIKTVCADLRNVVNQEVDDYFNILLFFENGIMAKIEVGTYPLSSKYNWLERHWFMVGKKGFLYVDGFRPKGKICRTTTAVGPACSFGPYPDEMLVTEEVATAETRYEDYFTNYIAAFHGREEFLVTIPEMRRVLRVMEAARESAAVDREIPFE
jgi:predicted dehydrogenase